MGTKDKTNANGQCGCQGNFNHQGQFIGAEKFSVN